jgi:hypothetical protein
VKQKSKRWQFWLIFPILLLAVPLILSACNTSTTQPEQNEVFLPATGAEGEKEHTDDSGSETQPEEVAYPDTEKDMANDSKVEDSSEEPYPEPVAEVAPTDVPMPTATSEPEPTQVPQPTSRGDALYASDSSNFSLASGQVQLVEMFAFW